MYHMEKATISSWSSWSLRSGSMTLAHRQAGFFRSKSTRSEALVLGPGTLGLGNRTEPMGFGPYATASMAAALEASASVAGRTLRGIMNFHRIESIDLYRNTEKGYWILYIERILIHMRICSILGVFHLRRAGTGMRLTSSALGRNWIWGLVG